MQAIVKTGAAQHKVKKGDKIKVNRVDAEAGAKVNLDVLMLLGDKLQVGNPLVEDAKVEAKVVRHLRGEKIKVATYKKRKGYHKRRGHRQELTELEISKI